MRICAIIGTRDEAELLGPAVAALLRCGAATITIMDDGSRDGTAALVARLARDPRIFAMPPPTPEQARAGIEAVLDFDGPVLGPIIRRDAPDWLMFCDSDEFLLSRGGFPGLAGQLHAHDVLEIARHNAVPGPRGIDPAALAQEAVLRRLPLIAGGPPPDPTRLAADPQARWILQRLPPKLLVRVATARGFGHSAHGVRPRPGQTLRHGRAEGVMMVHLPFTDLARFERKVANIADFLDRFGNLPAQWGWHWRRWLELWRDGRLAGEYARQCLDAQDCARLQAAGVLVTAEAVLDGRTGGGAADKRRGHMAQSTENGAANDTGDGAENRAGHPPGAPPTRARP